MKPGWVRIIAGKWRGRRLKVLDLPGLRPSPDRVRETLFNWLSPYIQGATCLDLYSGSGVLGFEALSRGAKQVVMVDKSARVVELLQSQLKTFQTDAAVVYRAQLPDQLQSIGGGPFDIVFIDPPYQEALLLPSCAHLEDKHFLAQNAYIYLEAKRLIKDNELPANWSMVKVQQAGQVFYHLAKRELK